jgi:hypothetical protein
MPMGNNALRSIVAALANTTTPHETLLSGGPISLRVTSTSAGPLAALTAAAIPYLQAVRSEEVRNPGVIEKISIHTAPVTAERLRWLAARPSEITGGVHLVGGHTDGDRQDPQAFLLWKDSAPHSSYLVLSRPRPTTGKIMLRLARGIAGRCLITAGWAPLHAAAAATRAGLIVLTGPSGSGKTTALLQLLAERLGHAFVANDKVYLAVRGGDVQARALPTSVALRADTVAMFPALGVTTSATHSHSDDPGQEGPGRRPSVPPRRAAEAFGVPLCPGGPVAAIVAIRFNGLGHPSWWRRTRPTRALETVTMGYLDDWFIDEPHEHSRLGMAPAHLRVAHHTTLHHIASAVPVFELEAGSGTPQALRTIITSLG